MSIKPLLVFILGIPILLAPFAWVLLTEPLATRDKYSRLRLGMTYPQVQAVMGRAGQEVSRLDSRSGSRLVVTWWNPDGSSLTATLENGELAEKSFERLR